MNKKKIDELIPKAVEVLDKVEIVDSGEKSRIVVNGRIKKTFRGQISTFGAAITNGSLISAVAFFSEKGGATVDRRLLIKAIEQLISETNGKNINLFDYVKDKGKESERRTRENILNAAIAIKLAMNLYDLD